MAVKKTSLPNEWREDNPGSFAVDILRDRLAEFQQKILFLNKKVLSKLDLPPLTTTVGAPWIKDRTVRASVNRIETGTRTEKNVVVTVTLTGGSIGERFDEWVLLAAPDILLGADGKRMVFYRINTSAKKEGETDGEIQLKLDSLERKVLQTVCDHCNTNRARNNIYILRNQKTDEIKVVGKNCLQYYFPKWSNGEKLEQVFGFYDLLLELKEEFDPDEEPGRGKADTSLDVREFMAKAIAFILENGYLSKKAANDQGSLSTSDLLTRNSPSTRYPEPTDEIYKMADSAIEWAQNISQEKLDDPAQNFFRAINLIAKATKVDKKHAAFLTAIYPIWKKEAELLNKIEPKVSYQPGEKISVKATYDGFRSLNNQYGTSLYNFTTEDGNKLSWFTKGFAYSNPGYDRKPREGDKVLISATAKDYNTQYQNYTILRAKVEIDQAVANTHNEKKQNFAEIHKLASGLFDLFYGMVEMNSPHYDLHREIRKVISDRDAQDILREMTSAIFAISSAADVNNGRRPPEMMEKAIEEGFSRLKKSFVDLVQKKIETEQYRDELRSHAPNVEPEQKELYDRLIDRKDKELSGLSMVGGFMNVTFEKLGAFVTKPS